MDYQLKFSIDRINHKNAIAGSSLQEKL